MENEETQELEKVIEDAVETIETTASPETSKDLVKEFTGKMKKTIKGLTGVSYDKEEDVVDFLKRAFSQKSTKSEEEIKAIYEKTLSSKSKELEDVTQKLGDFLEKSNLEKKERELADVINSIEIPKISDYVDGLARKDMANFFESKVTRNEDGSFTYDGELVILDGKVSKDIKAVAKEVLKNKVEELGVITTATKTKEARISKPISIEDRRQSVRSEIKKYNYRSCSEEIALLYKNHNFNLSECPAWVQTSFSNLFNK